MRSFTADLPTYIMKPLQSAAMKQLSSRILLVNHQIEPEQWQEVTTTHLFGAVMLRVTQTPPPPARTTTNVSSQISKRLVQVVTVINNLHLTSNNSSSKQSWDRTSQSTSTNILTSSPRLPAAAILQWENLRSLINGTKHITIVAKLAIKQAV